MAADEIRITNIIQTGNVNDVSPGWYLIIDSALETKKFPLELLAKAVSLLTIVYNLAPAYDSTRTYAEGELCTQLYTLYRCTLPGGIVTAEPWTVTHWSATSVSEIVGNVESLLAAL